MSRIPVNELQKPIPVRGPGDGPLLFWFRLLLDLQVLTIVRLLRPRMKQLAGNVLDVGAGESPYRGWLPAGTKYTGLDIESADSFGMTPSSDIVYYDGSVMPFEDAQFSAVLCLEVLEHAADPELLISEISRVLDANGTLLLTVPWSARRHHVPHDYHRFTRERLTSLISSHGFIDVDVRERGSDVAAIANKLLLLNIRLARPAASPTWLPRAVMGCVLAPVTFAFLLSAHVSVRLDLGSKEDPLGYFVACRKPA